MIGPQPEDTTDEPTPPPGHDRAPPASVPSETMSKVPKWWSWYEPEGSKTFGGPSGEDPYGTGHTVQAEILDPWATI